MRLQQVTPRQPIPDIPITPREGQSDSEVVLKHDDLYARAWECEYDESIFDSDYNNLATPSSPEYTIRSEQAADKRRNTPELYQKVPHKFFLSHIDRMTERTWITTRSLTRILV